jgi:hypothetical protein
MPTSPPAINGRWVGKIMTTPLLEAATSVLVPTKACDVCGHPDTAHDDIARRYCKATLSSALSRGCICSPLKI